MKLSTLIRNKELLKLYNKGIEPKQIANIMKLTPSNVYVILYRMRNLKKHKK